MVHAGFQEFVQDQLFHSHFWHRWARWNFWPSHSSPNCNWKEKSPIGWKEKGHWFSMFETYLLTSSTFTVCTPGLETLATIICLRASKKWFELMLMLKHLSHCCSPTGTEQLAVFKMTGDLRINILINGLAMTFEVTSIIILLFSKKLKSRTFQLEIRFTFHMGLNI